MNRLEEKVDRVLEEVGELKVAVAQLQTTNEVRNIPRLASKVERNEQAVRKIEAIAKTVEKLEENDERLLAWYWRTAGALAAMSVGMPFLIRWLFS